MRLRRSDRAARTAALQAEVVALRVTVASLRADLASAQASATAAIAAAAAAAPARELRWVSLDLPMVRAAVPAITVVPEVVEIDLTEAGDDVPAGATTMEIDLRDMSAPVEARRSALPEAALLDPRLARDQDVSDPALAGSTERATPERRIA
jgi:hypothetical protein